MSKPEQVDRHGLSRSAGYRAFVKREVRRKRRRELRRDIDAPVRVRDLTRGWSS